MYEPYGSDSKEQERASTETLNNIPIFSTEIWGKQKKESFFLKF